jgi:queuosine precursor transporter
MRNILILMMMTSLYIITYLFAIVLANFFVLWFGPVSTPINAFFLIGLDLTMRDKLHDKWRGNKLWLKMFILIAAGALITYLINRNAALISIASVTAFTIAAFADAVVYSKFINKSFLLRSNSSNVAGAIVDSILFPTIAFGTFMPLIVLGQFLAKFAGGFIWSLILNKKKIALKSSPN